MTVLDEAILIRTEASFVTFSIFEWSTNNLDLVSFADRYKVDLVVDSDYELSREIHDLPCTKRDTYMYMLRKYCNKFSLMSTRVCVD